MPPTVRQLVLPQVAKQRHLIVIVEPRPVSVVLVLLVSSVALIYVVRPDAVDMVHVQRSTLEVICR